RSGAEPQTAEDVLATLLSAGSRRGRDALVLMAQDFLDNLMSLRTSKAIEHAMTGLFASFSDTPVVDAVRHVHCLRLEQARREGNSEALRSYQFVASVIDRVTNAALELAVTGDDERASLSEFISLFQQADQLEDEYRRTGNRNALDAAAECWEKVLKLPVLSSVPASDRLADLNNASGAYLLRYEVTGLIADLDRAVSQLERVVTEGVPGSAQLAMHRSNLGAALRRRYERTGVAADLIRAVELFEQSAAETPAGTIDFALRLQNLGVGLMLRHDRTGDLADLDQAV